MSHAVAERTRRARHTGYMTQAKIERYHRSMKNQMLL